MSFSTGSGNGSGQVSTSADVALSSPQQNDALLYNSTLQKWQNSTPKTDKLATFYEPGVLAVATGTGMFPIPFGATIMGVSAICRVAPTGADVIVDIKKNGTTIFTTTANRPKIVASTTVASETVPDVTNLVAGDYLTVDVLQVGSTATGQDLTLQIRYR
jgi:hypothetical protein